MATNRIPPDEPDRAAPAQRGMLQRQAPRPVQAPGTAPTNSATAPVGTAARPSPNPISPVRPAMNTPPQAAMQPQPAYPVRPAYVPNPAATNFGRLSVPRTDVPQYVPHNMVPFGLSPSDVSPRVGEIGGGIDVRSYSGSMWPQLNPANAGPMAPRPIAPMRYPPNERANQPAPPLPTPRPPTPQTEAANPLTGPQSPQEEDTTDAIDPGSAMGFSRRGSRVPMGTDATNFAANTGAGRFGRPSAGPYGGAVRRLFDDPRDMG